MQIRSIKKAVVLLTILTVPGILYYLLQNKGKNRYRPLGIFGAKVVAPTFHTKRGVKIPDTLYHQISDFKLTNQDGQLTNFTADSSKLTVVNFFYTNCPIACSVLNAQMFRVARTYEKNKFLQFFSITADPHRDTPAILKQYAQQYALKPGKWTFLTGDEKLIYKLAKEDFLVDVLKDTIQNNTIIHSPLLVLIDSKKQIRGFYDARNEDQVDRLIDEIKVLIAEELRNVKDR